MEQYTIRNYRNGDFLQVLDILHETGYMGKNLASRKLFDHKVFFGRLFIEYYLTREKDLSFVSQNLSGHIFGYITGTLNTKEMSGKYLAEMVPKIALSLFPAITGEPRILKCLLSFLKNRSGKYLTDEFLLKYPAHFHINVRENSQNKGLGSSLLDAFEGQAIKAGCPGIHLKTSNKNEGAIKFYKKKGYDIMYEFDDTLWPDVTGYRTLIFAKTINVLPEVTHGVL